MIFFAAVITIAIFSFLWAFWSLKSLKKRTESIHAKRELAKGKVVFYNPGDK